MKDIVVSHEKQLTIGDVYRISRGPITTTQLVKYAGVSGDFNRIHFDHPFAVQAGLDGVIAHGMLTMGFAASCLSEAAGPYAQVTELSGRFLSLVRVGDIVEVTAIMRDEAPDHGVIVDLEARVKDRVVLRGSAKATYPNGSAAAAGNG